MSLPRGRRAGRRCAIALAALLAAVSSAWAGEKPATLPTRDVDVTYAIVLPGSAPGAGAASPGAPRTLEQRMRWAVALGKLRVDPPTPGLYMIVDNKTHRLATIRLTDRIVVEMNRVGGGSALAGGASGAEFTRRGEDSVAGLACTQWETRDAAGEPTLVCLTPDGVLLRAARGEHVLLVASKVTYAPIDPAAFAIPEGFRHIGPPPDDPPPRAPAK